MAGGSDGVGGVRVSRRSTKRGGVQQQAVGLFSLAQFFLAPPSRHTSTPPVETTYKNRAKIGTSFTNSRARAPTPKETRRSAAKRTAMRCCTLHAVPVVRVRGLHTERWREKESPTERLAHLGEDHMGPHHLNGRLLPKKLTFAEGPVFPAPLG